MFTNIVVGIDDSPTARLAVRAAGELAHRDATGPVHVVTGYHPISEQELAHMTKDLPREFRTELTSDQTGTAIAAAAEQQLRTMGVEAVTHVVPATGAEAVLDVADEVGADLIVVGSRSHGIGRRMRHGSVSKKVVHHAPCSVLVVHAA